MGSNARGSRIADVDLHDQQKRFEASGKTAVLFCREEGLPVSTFYQRRAHWKVNVPLTQNEFDALVDFTYNLGSGAFTQSTLLTKLNSGDYAGAAEEFERWDRAGGVVVAGLLRRRTAEHDTFLTI